MHESNTNIIHRIANYNEKSNQIKPQGHLNLARICQKPATLVSIHLGIMTDENCKRSGIQMQKLKGRRTDIRAGSYENKGIASTSNSPQPNPKPMN